MIYFDYNTQTSPAPEVIETMIEVSENLKNSKISSDQYEQIQENSRRQIASLIGISNSSEIIFTSGEEENYKCGIIDVLKKQPQKKHLIVSEFADESLQKLLMQLEPQGYEISVIGTAENSIFDLVKLKNSLRKDTALAIIPAAEDEIGHIFPVNEACNLIKEYSEALSFVDGSNAIGKIPVNLQNTVIDIFSLSGHKFHAPDKTGALYVRRNLSIQTQNILPLDKVAGIGEAAELSASIDENIGIMRDTLETFILGNIPNAKLNRSFDRIFLLPNTSSISFANLNGEVILAMLDKAGIIASTACPCDFENKQRTALLQSLNIPFTESMGTSRFSLGRYNTMKEVKTCIEKLTGIIQELNAHKH